MDSTASISGVTLATMQYDMVESDSDLEGFLIGTATQYEVKTFGDREREGTAKKFSFAIQGFMVTGHPFSFYDLYGNLQYDQLKRFFEGGNMWNMGNVIGWFKFRRNTPLRPSLRELEVHKQLQKIFNVNSRMGQNGFLMGLFNAQITGDKGIHTYDYKLIQIDDNEQTISVRLDIINLVSGAQEEYNSFNAVSPFLSSDAQVAEMLAQSPHVKVLESLFNSSFDSLKYLSQQVHESSTEIRLMEREVLDLRKKLNI